MISLDMIQERGGLREETRLRKVTKAGLGIWDRVSVITPVSSMPYALTLLSIIS